MKIQDSSFNGLKVTVGTKSVTHPRTHALTDAPKAICPINFFKVGGIITMKKQRRGLDRHKVLHGGWRSLVCQTTPLKI